MSRIPSSAILMTPERSEMTPPIAASAYGIVTRSTCMRNANDSKLTNNSTMLALPGNASGAGVVRRLHGVGDRSTLGDARPIRGCPCHGEDDDGLEDEDDLLGYLLCHGETTVLQRA